MRGRNIKIEAFKRRLAARRSVGPTDRLDKWLPRVSHGAQFFLSIVTAASLFYTVVPLYQKAILEESLAKREVELKAVEKTLDAQYVQVRDFFVRGFVMFSGPECTGLMLPPERLTDGSIKSRDRFDELTNIDPSGCLLKALEHSGHNSQLRPQDAKTFESSVRRVADELIAIKASFQKKKVDYLLRVESGKVGDEILDPAYLQLLKLQMKTWQQDDPRYIAMRKKMIESEVKLLLATEYTNSLSEKIRSLHELDWNGAR